ncbi:hypothetical protein Cantr_02601 [Candida viswanathii]|uniref:Uncharacterized protein n=1 Tax=Candida viswanathii TaxID=5486 RepID=A0A367YMB7_9ASCO|nr:hypothetical protein Cantr_02601 [Candida viswanathii]
MTPQLSSSTIDIIKTSSALYSNLRFDKLLVLSYTSSSSSSTSSPPSSSGKDFQLIGSLNVSTCQPLSQEYCTIIQTALQHTLLLEDHAAAEGQAAEKEMASNKVVYFVDSENHKMIGHFISQFIIVYIDVL